MAKNSYCDGVRRRDFLRVGVIGATGLSLAGYLRMAEAGQVTRGKATSAIFVNLGGGAYAIRNVGSGKYLDVAMANGNNDANIQQFQWNGSGAQRWRVRNQRGGVQLQNVNSGRCMDSARCTVVASARSAM